ncbi:hypothetical protein GCM10009827_071770 [Dactylosporangium maewongense]|uniref:Uncharacterized protein n=1 Tax=Dactylosporangium maewongense TaxID=634393 RepID=A0ABN2BIU8_9ACTN
MIWLSVGALLYVGAFGILALSSRFTARSDTIQPNGVHTSGDKLPRSTQHDLLPASS